MAIAPGLLDLLLLLFFFLLPVCSTPPPPLLLVLVQGSGIDAMVNVLLVKEYIIYCIQAGNFQCSSRFVHTVVMVVNVSIMKVKPVTQHPKSNGANLDERNARPSPINLVM